MPYYPQPHQPFTITQVSDINIAHQWKRTSDDTLCCTNTIPANQTQSVQITKQTPKRRIT